MTNDKKDWNRRPDGTFGRGNDGGDGRQPGTKLPTTELREAIKNHGTPERIAAVMDKLLENALKSPNTRSQADYLDRVDGKPTERIEVTGDKFAAVALHFPEFGGDNAISADDNNPLLEAENEKPHNDAEK